MWVLRTFTKQPSNLLPRRMLANSLAAKGVRNKNKRFVAPSFGCRSVWGFVPKCYTELGIITSNVANVFVDILEDQHRRPGSKLNSCCRELSSSALSAHAKQRHDLSIPFAYIRVCPSWRGSRLPSLRLKLSCFLAATKSRSFAAKQTKGRMDRMVSRRRWQETIIVATDAGSQSHWSTASERLHGRHIYVVATRSGSRAGCRKRKSNNLLVVARKWHVLGLRRCVRQTLSSSTTTHS